MKILAGSFSPGAVAMWLRKTCFSPVFWSVATAWRCENVPRSTSWPVKRTAWSSSRQPPKASASAVAQSTPAPSAVVCSRPSANIALFALSWRSSRLCTAKPSGVWSSAAPMRRSWSNARPVSSKRPWPSLGVRMCFQLTCFQLSSGVSYVSDATNASWNAFSTESSTASISACVNEPSAIRRSLYTASGVLWRLIAWYIVGCVNVGSSISLCPFLR